MPSPLSPAEIQYEVANIHDNRAPDLVVSTTVCLSLACVAVSLRLIARRLSKAKVWFDDYMIIVALVSTDSDDERVSCYQVNSLTLLT